jgi:hypothetical protein
LAVRDDGAMERLATANEEAIEAWNGVLFDRFRQYRDVLLPGLDPHGEEALRVLPPRRGERVFDIGCGFGDTTSGSPSSSPPRARRCASTPPRASSLPPGEAAARA